MILFILSVCQHIFRFLQRVCARVCVTTVCELIKENALQVSLYQLIGHEKRISDILIRRKKKKEKERKKMRAFTFLLCTKLLNRD